MGMGKSKVLVVGRGGREHALAWKFSQCPSVGAVYAAPGSRGMAGAAEQVGIAESDFGALAAFAKKEGIDLTVVGPEAPLVGGIADRLASEGLPVFGPSAAAAQIEGSKSFAKGLMIRHGIPTAGHEAFSDCAAACRHAEECAMPVAIKADGLAAGKGVVIAADRKEAQEALREMMEGGRFGDASRTVVVEEFLEGEEFSLMALVCGERAWPMALSQDHKRAFDGDLGPNTGGMGAYSPVPQIPASVQSAAEGIAEKAAAALASEGRSFTGFLYAGLIATAEGPKVIEFNARLGDPEAQALLPRLESDLFEAISALTRGGRESAAGMRWSGGAAVAVVLASKGYPGEYPSGFPIEGLGDLMPDTLAFHGGTDVRGGRLTAAGGRALALARRAPTIAQAQKEAYEEIGKIRSPGLFWRGDIGWRALAACGEGAARGADAARP